MVYLRAIGKTGNVLKNWFVDPEAADYALGMIMKPLTNSMAESPATVVFQAQIRKHSFSHPIWEHNNQEL